MVLSGGYHIIFDASIANNCFIIYNIKKANNERNKHITKQHYKATIYMYQPMQFFFYPKMSRNMRKPIFNMYKNEDADQLCGNHATVRSVSLFLLQIGPLLISA